MIFLNVIKGIYKKRKSIVILSGERPGAFPIRSGSRQEDLLSELLLDIGLKESLSNKCNRVRKRKKGKEEIKQFLFSDELKKKF